MLTVTGSRSLGLLLLCAPLASQAVLVVAPVGGAGVDYTTLQAAIDASADGGVVLVKPGSYTSAAASFTIDGKALTLIASEAGAVDFGPNSVGVIRATQPQQNVHVRGLPDNDGTTLRVSNCAGPVWIENSRLHRPLGSQPPSGPALWVTASNNVIVEDCSLYGGKGAFFLGELCLGDSAQGALDVDASVVYAHDSQLQGLHGKGGLASLFGCSNTSAGAPALLLRNASFMSLEGGSATGGGGGGCVYISGCVATAHGPGIELRVASTLAVVDTAIAVGVPFCASAFQIAPIQGACGTGPLGTLIPSTELARSFDALAPAVAGQFAQLELNGQPGDFGFAGVSGAVTGLPLPGLGYLVLAQPISVVALGAVDASGKVVKQLALPPSLPQGTALVSHLQGAVLDAQLAIRLAAPSLLVTLASAP